MQLRIFSVEGKLVWQAEIQAEKEIDLNHSLTPGIYIMK